MYVNRFQIHEVSENSHDMTVCLGKDKTKGKSSFGEESLEVGVPALMLK